MKVYVLSGSSGQYDDYGEWIVGIFDNPTAALLHADTLMNRIHVWYYHKAYEKPGSYEETIVDRNGEILGTQTVEYTSRYRECWIAAYGRLVSNDTAHYQINSWELNDTSDQSDSDFWEEDKDVQTVRPPYDSPTGSRE